MLANSCDQSNKLDTLYEEIHAILKCYTLENGISKMVNIVRNN